MPREIIHWSVLTEATAELQRHGVKNIAETLSEMRAAAFLGAMSHDVPYYYHGGGHPFEEVASILHGTHGNDTFEPLRVLARRISIISSPDERRLLVAFLLGMLSHAVTDICFHPMVFYFTGDYYDPNPQREHVAQARHRLLETYMDSYMRAQVKLWNNYRYSAVLRELGTERVAAIANILDEVFIPQKMAEGAPPAEKPWHGAFREVTIYQDLFFSSVVGAGFKAVDWILNGKLRGIDVLFSYGRGAPHPFFSQALDFQNPVSGERHVATLFDLRNASAKRCVELFSRFEPFVQSANTDLSQALAGIVGESLNFGLKKVTSRDAKFYYQGEMPFTDW